MKKLFVLPMMALAANSFATEEMETTLVTATRTAQSIDKTLTPSTVIDREQILQLQAEDIFDLLNHVPGVTIIRNGGVGSKSSLFIRGTNSNHSLVLVNGQRIGSATLGEASIQHISPEQIERIEIIRGPRASLYGADAVGGVINIITNAPKEKNEILVKQSYGSYETNELVIGGDFHFGDSQSGWGQLNISAGINYLEVDGFNRTVSATGANKDDDEYENTSRDFSLEYAFSDLLTSGINYLRNSGEIDYDNYCTNSSTFVSEECKPFTRYEIETSNIYLNLTPAEIVNINATASRSIDSSKVGDHLVADSSTIYGGDSYFETERTAASLQTDVRFTNKQILSIGLDYYKDEVESLIRTSATTIAPHTDANGNTVDSIDNKAVFIQYQADFDFIGFTTSLREDDNEAYGKNTTGNIALGIPILSQHKMIVSYGTAFNAPTFNDLYWPDPYGPGNPELKPEESKNYELGFRGFYDIAEWQVNIFKNEITDLIQWQPIDPDDPYSPWSPYNVSEVDIIGTEISASTDLSSWKLSSSYSYIKTEDKSSGKELLRRPKQSFSLNIDKSIGKWDIGASLLAFDSRFDDVNNNREFGGYSTTDLRFAYHPWDAVTLQFKAGNLFDKEYTVASGYAGNYATEGRTGLFSIIFTPQF